MDKLPFAEDVNYWKTGQNDPDSWIDRAIKQVTNIGGTVLRHAFRNDAPTTEGHIVMEFRIGGDISSCVASSSNPGQGHPFRTSTSSHAALL